MAQSELLHCASGQARRLGRASWGAGQAPHLPRFCRLAGQADEGWARAADQGKSCVSTQSEPRAAKDAQRSVAKTSYDDLSQEGLPGALSRAVRRSSCMSGMVFAFRHFAFHHFAFHIRVISASARAGPAQERSCFPACPYIAVLAPLAGPQNSRIGYLSMQAHCCNAHRKSGW